MAQGVAAVTSTRIKRSEQGYRVGDSHHNAKAPDAAVRMARDLYEFERMGKTAIARRLFETFGILVSVATVKHWIYYTSRNVTPREREERTPTHRTVR